MKIKMHIPVCRPPRVSGDLEGREGSGGQEGGRQLRMPEPKFPQPRIAWVLHAALPSGPGFAILFHQRF